MIALVRQVGGFLEDWSNYGLALAREREAGLWQVIDFQLDKYMVSRRFTINLGLYEEGLTTLLDGAQMDNRRPSTDCCQLRVRLGQLIDGTDKWWELPLDGPTEPLARDLCSELGKFALPDLDRFQSRQAIADAWIATRDGSFLGRAKYSPWFRTSRMVLAGLLTELGRVDAATAVADAESAEWVGHPKEHWIKSVALRLADGRPPPQDSLPPS